MLQSLKKWEEKCVNLIGRYLPFCAPYVHRYQRLLRYLVAGSTAAAVDLCLIYLLTDRAGLHYLWSAAIAFAAAFFVSFLLQKFWTFEDTATDRMHIQMTMYFFIAIGNLFVNTALMFAFVDWLGMWYLFAQVLASGLIAIESFFIARHVVFKTHKKEDEVSPRP